MRRSTNLILASEAVLAIMLCAGCGGPSRVVPEKPAHDSGSAALQLLDANHDGQLSPEEASPGLQAGWKQADQDQSGTLTAAEIDQRRAAWASSQVGRMTVPCVVTWQGNPLAGAEVKFVPEPFLGSELPPASGTTNAQGGVSPTAAESASKPPGLAPGYYRVEIVAQAPSLPAKYNTATILGIEVAPDAEGLLAGPVVFELK